MFAPPQMNCDTDAARLVEMAHGLWTTQALFAAAELGLADALASGGPMRAEALAEQRSCNADAVHRLLRGLSTLGVCEEIDDGRFALTALGAPLAARHAASLQPWVLLAGRRLWKTWSGFTDAVRTGLPVGLRDDEADRFERLQRDPSEADDLHSAMAALTRQLAPAVAASVASLLAPGATVVDVGGGNGELLCAVLQAAPLARGIVLDRLHAAPIAETRIAVADLAARAGFVAGDFFEAVPMADLLLMKSVLHDWDDETCVRLLACCSAALRPGGAVAIVERVLPNRVDRDTAQRHTYRSDLNMLVATGGRERRLAEFSAMLSAAGLQIDAVMPAALDFAVVIARAAGGAAR
jgi:hypothetical protein